MSTQAEIEQRILRFVREELLPNARELTAESDLLAEGFDSLSLVSLLLFVEREFGVWIPEKSVTQKTIGCVRNMAASVRDYLGEKTDPDERHRLPDVGV